MKQFYIILLSLIFNNLYASITTQYPGCPPDGSTAAEVLTRPYKYYPPQVPLNTEAIEAKQAEKNQ